jgi:glycosyltransferase involved in cell wall biosynthesis/GT2 family glycosyltransferase
MASAGSDRPGSICLVANDLDHVVKNSGIGTYYSLMAPLLVNAGWRVHILYLGFADDPEALTQAPIKLRRQGVSFSLLNDFETPEMMRVRTVHACHGEHEPGKGVRILQALEELHRVYHFDLIEFPDWLAFGFRTIQARRTGRCLESAGLCVKLHATSAWQREGNHCWPEGPSDLSLDFRERYAFENADVQMSPSRYMLDYVERQGWKVGDAFVAYPFPEPVVPAPRTDDQTPSEVVFFGRLEIRKGLDLFLDAASDLPANVNVTFLGRDTVLPSGQSAVAYIEHRLRGRSFKIHTDMMREQALHYLAAENRLAVIPSLAETFGFTVAECAVNGLPFLAARAGGTAEVIPDLEVQEGLYFEPTSRDLARSLTGYLKMPPARRRALRLQARKVVDPKVRNGRVTEVYGEALERFRRESKPRLSLSINASAAKLMESPSVTDEWDARAIDSEGDANCVVESRQADDDDPLAPDTVAMPSPLVTVAIPYYNLGLYLPATLEAIAAQTYSRIEVIVVDDGSTCPSSIRVFNDLRELYPQFRFISQKNSGPGAARNRALAEARGEFFIPVDADNVAAPTMIERFVEGMMRNPELSVLTCFLKAFNHDEGIDAEVSEFVYMPTGGPFVVSCFENVYGDTNAIFRTQHFRDAGGFETDPNTFIEDWETFVKLAAAGLKIDVIPDALFYYRIRGDNRSLTMSRDRSDMYPFVQRMIQRRFVPLMELAPLDADMLWLGMAAFGNRKPAHRAAAPDPHAAAAAGQPPSPALRYRVADKVNSYLKWIAPVHRMCRSIITLAMNASRARRRSAPAPSEAGTKAETPPANPRTGKPRWPRIRGERANRAA